MVIGWIPDTLLKYKMQKLRRLAINLCTESVNVENMSSLSLSLGAAVKELVVCDSAKNYTVFWGITVTVELKGRPPLRSNTSYISV